MARNNKPLARKNKSLDGRKATNECNPVAYNQGAMTMARILLAATVLATSLLTSAALVGQADAKTFCTVADPTGTPLNVRTKPMGTILGALNNDTSVMLDDLTVVNGDKWAKVITLGKGKSGWVYFNYLDC
jgi:hypothetical protein